MARYLELNAFKQWWKTERLADDVLIEAELVATEQAIDNALLRRIALADAVSSARAYRSAGPCSSALVIDDAAEIVSVVDDGTTLVSGTDYIAEPLNGISLSGDPRPYHALVRASGSWSHNGALPTITVTAKWGWAEIPPEIITAGRIEAADRLANREFRNGLVAVTEDGIGIGGRLNKTVQQMIQHYEHPIKSLAIA